MADRVAEALFGKTRRNVLSLLFSRPDEQFYMRQIARMTGVSTASVQHELARLTEAELVIRSPDGKQVYYRANTSSPVFSEIRSLMEKTVGAVAVLRTTLSDLSREDRVDIAFIYGSVAAGTHGASSDVDVLIIGDIKLTKIIPSLRAAQDRLGREINPSIYPAGEFRGRAADREHFVSSVLIGPKIMLIGSENDLERLVAESLDQRAQTESA